MHLLEYLQYADMRASLCSASGEHKADSWPRDVSRIGGLRRTREEVGQRRDYDDECTVR